MFGRTSLLKATALALPFSLAAAAAHAASIAETVQQQEELSIFAQAMAAAKFDQQLSGEGPYTVFAPTDQAFEQLPEGALDELMKQDNQAQLTRLLEHHVVEGKAISAKDMLGQQSQIDAMSGDQLTVDGTSQVVLLVPTGLTIARVGEQMVIEREGVAVSTRAISIQDHVVRTAGGSEQQAQGQQQAHGQMQGQQGQQAGAQTSTAQGSDMPMSPHQQQALESQPAPDQQQTAAGGSADMPATEHQQQALQAQPGQDQGQGQQQAQGQGQMQGQAQAQGQQGQQAGAQTSTAQGSNMPMSPHQQQALESQPAPDQQQTAAAGTADMPASEHQRQVIQDQAGQSQGQAQGQHQAQGQQAQGQGQMQGQQAGAQTPTAQGSDMPLSPHQQQALESEPAPDQQQTAGQGATDVPASPHQRQLLAEDELPGEQQQYHEDAAVRGAPDLLREASVVGADIQADNGVIHVIDAVLLPQDLVKMLEQDKQGQD